MVLQFEKYQGTGNDFIIIDDRTVEFPIQDNDLIQRLCDRKFGIGADGLILLQKDQSFDFKMIYFNADGKESTMCGNGGRCIVAFAHKKGIVGKSATFRAIDGEHEAFLLDNGWVRLKMQDVKSIEKYNTDWILDTGSPHYVKIVSDISKIDVYQEGRKIRYSNRFKTEGINVNFVQLINNRIYVATYERGVENETLSCGTGVTAAGIIYGIKIKDSEQPIKIDTKGGSLEIEFNKTMKNNIEDIWLSGFAEFIFKGEIGI